MAIKLDPDRPDLTADTETQNDIFLQAFNSGDGELFDRLYRPDSISNFSGSPLVGQERREFFVSFLATRPALKASVRSAYVAGDVALIAVEYTIDGTTADGSPMHLEGYCTDVLRRGADGRWLMAIDRPVDGTLLPKESTEA